MIESIKLKNFKCFRDMNLSMAEMTILAGANAAGKSSVIQALQLFFATIREKDSFVDVADALHMEIGSPHLLISQNPIELPDADFLIGITCNGEQTDIRYKINKLTPLRLSFQKPNRKLGEQLFYLNAERRGPRISYPAKVDENIMSDGSNAAYLIDRGDMQGHKVSKSLLLDGAASKFSVHVEEWMNVILEDVTLSVNVDLNKATTDIRYSNALVDHDVLPTMTGFGISYILAIVTAGLWCSSLKNAVLIIENPEAHLHPRAQSQMGKFLYLVSASGVQVIVETHSEHIIDGARIQAALMKQTECLSINFLSEQERKIVIEAIKVKKNGELEKWPEGFFDQKTQDLRELFELRRKSAGK